MEPLEDSNCHSMTDSLSLYERYLRSFNVVDSFVEENRDPAPSNCEYETSCDGNSNGDFSVSKLGELVQSNLLHPLVNNVDKVDLGADLCLKHYSNLCASPAASTENSSATASHSILTEKSDPADVPMFSEDSKSDCFKQPVFITPTMENSNNAVDSVPLFRSVGRSESVFKLPISELTFNGTIKSIQKLKPIVDPITALSSQAEVVSDEVTDKRVVEPFEVRASSSIMGADPKHNNEEREASSESSEVNRMDKGNDSTGDSQYEEYNLKNVQEGNLKWNEQSYSSLEGSFDSGVRSPDMFSDDDAPEHEPPESFWNFLVDYEKHDKRIVQKLEATLQGVLPPPSVTTLKTDVTEMLKKYHSHKPMFSDEKVTAEVSSTTPVKRVSYIQIPSESLDSIKEPLEVSLKDTQTATESHSTDNAKPDDDTSLDKSIQLKINTEIEAKETAWPYVMKCRHYDLHYNLTCHSERVEQLAARLGERFVGAETACSVGGPAAGRSPGSAAKAKALRIKLAQANSPGRRLSHLARRRQAFASAATVAAGAPPAQRMVLIDRNFFQHRKLISSAERRSPRLKRTPGRKTPARKTPAKTPRSGGSGRRRPQRADSEGARAPPRESLIKRALFVSPEQRARPPQPAAGGTDAAAAGRSRRALFGLEPAAGADPGPASQPAKRARDASGDPPQQGRSKVAKSLSFGGDGLAPAALGRRASDVFPTDRNPFDLNEAHKKKLLWAVSEALRAHGWRMSRAGFREKAAALARLTRRLLTLRPHAARFAAPQLSSSETMLRVARLYAYAVIQGRTVEECFLEEQARVAGEASAKLSGYISAADYQRLRQAPADRVKENHQAAGSQAQPRPDQPRSSKKILQDTTVNIDSNSNSSGSSVSLDTSVFFKSQSMPSFEEAAKMKASRLVSATWSSLKSDFTKSILSPL